MLKTRGKLYTMYKATKVRLMANISPEIVENRQQWDDIFKALKEKNNCQ